MIAIIVTPLCAAIALPDYVCNTLSVCRPFRLGWGKSPLQMSRKRDGIKFEHYNHFRGTEKNVFQTRKRATSASFPIVVISFRSKTARYDTHNSKDDATKSKPLHRSSPWCSTQHSTPVCGVQAPDAVLHQLPAPRWEGEHNSPPSEVGPGQIGQWWVTDLLKIDR